MKVKKSHLYGESFGTTSPAYDISVTNSYEAIWYTLNIGSTNISASGLIGTIDQTEWNKQDYEGITIRFYANNSLGKVNYAEVRVIKVHDEWKFLREISIPEDTYQIKILLKFTHLNIMISFFSDYKA
ncbi:MAG: hypothetical protein ACFE78_02215 [Candidatus Hodarchaeota archaeon]